MSFYGARAEKGPRMEQTCYKKTSSYHTILAGGRELGEKVHLQFVRFSLLLLL